MHTSAFHGTDLAGPGSAADIPGWMNALGCSRQLTLGLRITLNSRATSRPLHGEGVNPVGADVAGEDRGAVRGDADFGVGTKESEKLILVARRKTTSNRFQSAFRCAFSWGFSLAYRIAFAEAWTA